MPGTITRFAIAEADFCLLANGCESAILVYAAPFGAIVCALYIRWPWDDNFTALAGYALEADEVSLIQEILTSAGLWNAWFPTWKQLSDGDVDYVTSEGTFSGSQAVAKRFQDWTRTQTVETCERATDSQWFRGLFIAQLQEYSDDVYLDLVIPPPPPPPLPPTIQFPPQAVGMIQSAMGLLLAQVTRLYSVADTANPNRPVITAIPVPH